MEKAENFYWKLFKSTFIISAFTVGGGFAPIGSRSSLANGLFCMPLI